VGQALAVGLGVQVGDALAGELAGRVGREHSCLLGGCASRVWGYR
jgi:hypothetical protein